ncbi:hypothetical protein [Streptomyces xiamenensis]|uniref:hypothetical protein n=1 Tax=Streptomyces xiamenensis TaxID=408015 RepID=UPI0035DA5AEB
MKRTSGVRSKATAWAGATLLAVTALSGCSDNNTDADSSPSPSAPDAGPTEPEGEPGPSVDPGEEAVLAVYDSYWTEYAAAVSEPGIDEYLQLLEEMTNRGDDEPPLSTTAFPVGEYATGEAFTLVTRVVTDLDAGGLVMAGAPERISTEITSLDADAQTPTAEFRDCLAVEGWTVHERASGEEIAYPDDRLLQQVVTAKAEQWEGKWLITEVVERQEVC